MGLVPISVRVGGQAELVQLDAGFLIELQSVRMGIENVTLVYFL